jgi:AraC family transcriptional regulator
VSHRPEPSQQQRTLFRSPEIRVIDFRCRVACHSTGPEEWLEAHSIVFVRAGTFRWTVDGETIAADPNYVLFFDPSRPYRIAHPVAGGDDCTAISLSPRLVRDVVAAHAARDAETADTAFRVRHAFGTPRALALQYELVALLRAADPPRIAVQDLVLTLADEAVRAVYRGAGGGTAMTAEYRQRRRDLAEAARTRLQASMPTPPSLDGLAQALGCSPFHLSRTFRQVVGMPIRRYVARLRVRAAAAHLAAGARDLTALALELGYADHSHLTNAFREEWGVPPSRFRAGLASRAHRPAVPMVAP